MEQVLRTVCVMVLKVWASFQVIWFRVNSIRWNSHRTSILPLSRERYGACCECLALQDTLQCGGIKASSDLVGSSR